MSIQKILLPILMTTVLAACGGGSDNDGDLENQGNQGPVVDGSAVGTAEYKAYLRTKKVEEIGAAPQSLTVPVNAGGNILGMVTVNYVSGNLKPTADGGYIPSGGFTSVLVRGHGAIQLCSGGKAVALLLPPGAVLATVKELEGQTFNYYEDCQQNSLSTLAFKAGGGATFVDEGNKEDFSSIQIAQLLGSRVSDFGKGTTAFRAYKLETGRYVLVEHGDSEGGRVGLWAGD